MRATTLIVLGSALMISSCSSSPEGSGTAAGQDPAQAQPTEQIRDETHRFHKDGLLEAKVVQDNLGGKEFMPGGNLAEYEKDGQKYRVFFTLRRNADAAMFLWMDYRDVLSDPQFVPHFGGFYGLDGETPTLIFQKNKYVVGVAGLELDAADQAGRMIAGYLN